MTCSKDRGDDGKMNPVRFLDLRCVEEKELTGYKVEVKIIYLQNGNI